MCCSSDHSPDDDSSDHSIDPPHSAVCSFGNNDYSKKPVDVNDVDDYNDDDVKTQE